MANSSRTEKLKMVKPHSSKRFFSVIDLFAGCGGLSLGLEKASFTPVFVNELNPDAMSTYLRNRHHRLGGEAFAENPKLHCNDVADLTDKRIEILKSDLSSIREVAISFKQTSGSTLDLIAGGPPCQGYSGIGHRRSYSVDKIELPSNRLYQQMIRIIVALRPRIFLFENVRGLMTSKWTDNGVKGEIWLDVLKAFRQIDGYEVRWKLVKAKDYGVPQNRPRILLVGVRKDIVAESSIVDLSADKDDAVLCGMLPEPNKKIDRFPSLGELLGDLVDPKIQAILESGQYAPGVFRTESYPHKPQNPLQRALRTSTTGKLLKFVTEQEYSKHAPDVVSKFRYMLANDGRIPPKFQTKKFSQRVLPEIWGAGGPTITATSLPDDYVHYCQPRILTVREWARLQLFPDWYEFSGKRTTGGTRRAGNPREGLFEREVPKYTQIGNAVPVALAQRIGEHFRKILDEVT